MSNYGSFSGDPKTKWLSESNEPDRYMELLEDFVYTDANGKKWIAKKGTKINGASIPRALWSIVGSPFAGDYRRASIVHDAAIKDSSIEREEADKMFYYACLAGGCSKEQTALLFAGTRLKAYYNKSKNINELDGASIFSSIKEKYFGIEKEIRNKYFEIAKPIKNNMANKTFEELSEWMKAAIENKKIKNRIFSFFKKLWPF
ncbi:MAG: DUF1353 domain-containing protein [Spirochaetia bacterium]|nr:DUF1353 domain-containing protein [Spirochaetia bacterium]